MSAAVDERGARLSVSPMVTESSPGGTPSSARRTRSCSSSHSSDFSSCASVMSLSGRPDCAKGEVGVIAHELQVGADHCELGMPLSLTLMTCGSRSKLPVDSTSTALGMARLGMLRRSLRRPSEDVALAVARGCSLASGTLRCTEKPLTARSTAPAHYGAERPQC